MQLAAVLCFLAGPLPSSCTKAAHMVVSIRSTPLVFRCSRTAFDQARGPPASSTSRHPLSRPLTSGTTGRMGMTFEGGGPTAGSGK
jgi:hypothetical protein